MLSAAFLAESVRSSLSFFPVARFTEMPVVAKKRFGTARSGGAKKSSRSNWKVVMPRRLASPLRSENLATRVTFISIRSEERRVGKECRSLWSPEHKKKKIHAREDYKSIR